MASAQSTVFETGSSGQNEVRGESTVNFCFWREQGRAVEIALASPGRLSRPGWPPPRAILSWKPKDWASRRSQLNTVMVRCGQQRVQSPDSQAACVLYTVLWVWSPAGRSAPSEAGGWGSPPRGCPPVCVVGEERDVYLLPVPTR